MNKAFSIIELLVVVLIFSIVIGAAVGVFVSALKIQKYNLSHQQLLNQVSYAMEYMDRSIRMAMDDELGLCIPSWADYLVSNGGQKIEFMNYEGNCQEFYLSGTQLTFFNSNIHPNPLPLTSDDFTVTSLQFSLIDTNNTQPRVTITMEIEGNLLGSRPKMRIQTTVSQRNLDMP